MEQKSIADAVQQICEEKGISVESVIETIEAALAAAYRKDFGEKNQNIKVEFDLETGKSKVFNEKTVVEDMPEEELEELKEAEDQEIKKLRNQKIKDEEKPKTKLKAENEKKEKDEKETKEDEKGEGEEDEEEIRRFNPKTEIQISDAKEIKKSYKVDDIIRTPLKIPGDFGRMAAQTAKQVIIQKLRETEREALYKEFKKQEGEIMVGTVQRREGNMVLVDLGRLTALLPQEEQIRSENYAPGSHLKVFIASANSTSKGPEVIISRSHPEIVKKLFFLEIPEIASGVVEIKSIAREAGSRSKIAVHTDEENIDPIGSCIGQRGARIQTIISELKGEKVDIIKYSDDPKEYIANALSPAKITEIILNEKEKTATAKVVEDQLSLAIGKAGQNVRLAARLTGWKIDIISDAADQETKKTRRQESKEGEDDKDDKEEKKETKKDKDEKVKKETKEDKKKNKKEEDQESKKKENKKEDKDDKKDDEKKDKKEDKKKKPES